MKCQVKVVVLLGLCCVNSLPAMQDEDGRRTGSFVDVPLTDTPAVPPLTGTLQRNASHVSPPSPGHRSLKSQLQTLSVRMAAMPRILRPPLNIHYVKYHAKLNSQYFDQQDESSSPVYQSWAGKVRAINEASYIAILLKSYPKTFASVITLISGALLAGGGYGGYRLFEYYTKQQQEQKTDEADGNQVPATGNADAINPVA